MTSPSRTVEGIAPHSGRPIHMAGPKPPDARLTLVALHGRGGSARDMLALAIHAATADIAILAPEASGNSWYPQSFLAPLAANEPGISSGVSVVVSILDMLEAEGVGATRTVLAGFSQGACLALETTARAARSLRAVTAFSGGLIGTADVPGPARADLYGHAGKAFDYPGSLTGLPVLLACHERDPHIPMARVRESERVLGAMGANVSVMSIPGAGHGIVPAEIAWLRKVLAA